MKKKSTKNKESKNISAFGAIFYHELKKIRCFCKAMDCAIDEVNLEKIVKKNIVEELKGKESSFKEIIDFLERKQHKSFRDRLRILYLNIIFEEYLHNITYHHLSQHKGCLGSIEVSIEELETLSKEEIIDNSIQESIRKLMFGNYKKAITAISKKCGLKQILNLLDDEDFRELDKIRDLRNLILHQNALYAEKKIEIDNGNILIEESVITLDSEDIFYMEEFVFDIVKDIDRIVCEKYPEKII